MRRVSVDLIPVDGAIHPADGALGADPDIRRRGVEYLNRLADGTGVMLYRLAGDKARIESILADTDDVIDADVLPTSRGHRVYVHFEVDGTVGELFRLIDRYEAVIDFPVACTDDGFRGTVIGRLSEFSDAIEDLPDGLRVELRSITAASADPKGTALLTDRQREVLELAVEAGYYDHPARVTREELADRLDVSGSTVSEHLRKAEAKVLTDFVE